MKIASSLLRVSSQIKNALSKGQPVVALQSTIISHGMPYPNNYQCAISLQKVISSQGAIPATVAVIDGYVQVGLTNQMIQRLAQGGDKVQKISRRDFPYILSNKLLGATTVSGTMIAARMSGIDVFVTGGIGGIHRGYEETMDASADLRELGRSRVAVVCGGVKSILDIGRTLEYLQTEGVPVVTYGSEVFPAFFSASSGIRSPLWSNSIDFIAEMIHRQQLLNLDNGMLIGVPNPNPAEGIIIQNAIEKALKQCKQKEIKGAKITPFLLSRVNELTQGLSLKSNIGLVHNNAKIGAKLAVSLSNFKKRFSSKEHQSIQLSMNSQNSIDGVKIQNKVRTSGHNKDGKIIIIGGSAIDYQFKSGNGLEFELYKSCIGKSRRSLGGVGRNIAECVGRLGGNPILITAISSDPDGVHIKDSCNKLNINVCPIMDTKLATGKYLAIMDKTNNQLLGISDMEINSLLNFNNVYQAYFKEAELGNRDIVIVDANFDEETLAKLGGYLSQKGCFTIYEGKGQKSKKILRNNACQHFSLLKINKLEYQQINTEANKVFTTELYQNIGKRQNSYTSLRIITTDGPNNLTTVNKEGKITSYPVPKVLNVKKTTGAGDTFTGVFATMLLQGKKDTEAIQMGLIGSKIAVESDIEESVIPNALSMDQLRRQCVKD